MSQPINFQSLPFTANVPNWLNDHLDSDTLVIAHSTQELSNGADLTSRLWVVKENHASYFIFADLHVFRLSAELDIKKKFIATVLFANGVSTIQFVQNEKNVGEAFKSEDQLTLVEPNKEKILGAIVVLALITLGATYFTGSFPFNAQKA